MKKKEDISFYESYILCEKRCFLNLNLLSLDRSMNTDKRLYDGPF